jgi:2-keto-4-pentenoate hydratase/2-oxohepta-3-ene-1,7-dioic acid hydratase in catechol pathway
VMTLEAGDIVATGTPAGVGRRRQHRCGRALGVYDH